MGKVSRLVRSVKAFTREFSRAPQLPSIHSEPPKRPKIGIALGGGFARGLAHIGVIKVLEENNIPIDFVAGTSVGSVIGAAYCSGVTGKELEEVARLVRMKDFSRWTISRFGLATNDRMAGFLGRVLRCKTFEDLKTPLAVVATDFVTGEGAVFTKGPLVDPVRASCAYPGMFLPVKINGQLLVDGLLAQAVPTLALRDLGAERVLAIYLSAHWVNLKGPRHIFDVIGQCFSIAQAKMSPVWQAGADLIVQPDVRGFSYDGFERADELVAVGEAAAREALPTLLEWVGRRDERPVKAAAPATAPSAPEHAGTPAPVVTTA
jgi:NTE family protein